MGLIVVDACLRQGRGGTPTAVLDEDPALGEDERRAAPARAGTSHAAFVDAATGTVRFYTGTGELTNCGHGTIAAQAVLLDRAGLHEHATTQLTGGRRLEVTARRCRDGVEVWFTQGQLALTLVDGHEALLAALGVTRTATGYSLAVASPGTPRLLVPVPDRATLASLTPRFDRADAECRRLGYLGCFAYVPPSPTRPAAARMFAPSIGVPEDVANANSTGALAAYLLAHHDVGEVSVDQGDQLGRPSTVYGSAWWQGGHLVTRVGGVGRVPGTA